MREERPQKDTTYRLDAVYTSAGTDAAPAAGDGGSDPAGTGSPDPAGTGSSDQAGNEGTAPHGDEVTEVAVRGRLPDADGDLLVRFLDVFTVGPDGFERLDTYTQ